MRIYAVAFSTNGCRTAIRLRDSLPEEDVRLFCKTSSDTLGVEAIEGKVSEWTGRAFAECDAVVFIGAVGIAVRHIAPYVVRKDRDPAVVCLDEHARWAISLLSGHIGGGNDLTRRIADALGSEPVITTATDINSRFSVDSFAVANHLRISSLAVAKDVSARVLDGRFVGFCSEIGIAGEMPSELTPADSGELGVCVSYDTARSPFAETLVLTPMDTVLGVGCRRGTDPSALMEFIEEVLREEGLDPARVRTVASIDLKADEPAVLEAAETLSAGSVFFTAEELTAQEGEFTSSDFVRSVTGVDSVCERSVAACGADIIRRKTARDGMTLAVGRIRVEPRFIQ